ncbi:MAG TPA: FUSC family protein [Actinoplanes sp.]|nr:FUSC family protein [Actinoplanes sp.]
MTATTLRQLWHVAPHAGAHHPALRMGVAALIPMTVLTAAGHADWAGWALLGTVTAAYARSDTPRRRLRVQAAVGLFLLLLVIAATVLVAAAVPGIVLVLATALVAGLATVLADTGRWSPPGALFPVFVFGAATTIPAGFTDLPAAAGFCAAGLLWALSVTAFSDYLRTTIDRHRADPSTPPPFPPEPASPPQPRPAGLFPSGSAGLSEPRPAGLFPPRPAGPARPAARLTALHALVCLVGAGVSGALALAAGLQHPSWAMVAAVVPVVGTATGPQILRAGHRLIGTLLGVGVSGLIFLHAPGPLEIAVLTGFLLFGAELMIARNYSLALLFITPVTIGLAHPDTPDRLLTLMADRALETAIGVLVAVTLILASHQTRHSIQS